jgi:mono/diheme cytochrome c family protein
MMAVAHLSDQQIAAVLTYVRNSFGNKASAVTPDQVKAFRGEVGLPALQASDLKAPK